MASSKKSIERADAIQRSTLTGWYLAVCFIICVAGGVWFASAAGMFGLGSTETEEDTYKLAARAAARKAAAREEQARLAAREDARNIAADGSRQAVNVPKSAESPSAAASAASSEAAASATPAATETAAKSD